MQEAEQAVKDVTVHVISRKKIEELVLQMQVKEVAVSINGQLELPAWRACMQHSFESSYSSSSTWQRAPKLACMHDAASTA